MSPRTSGTRLRGITWEHPRGHGSMQAAATEYARLTGVTVDWDQRSLQAFADAPLAALAASYDLLVIDHPHVPEAAEDGLLARLDGMGFDDELADLVLHSVGASQPSYDHGGHTYGLASDAAAQVAAYRPDLLPQAPATWDAVLTLAGQGRVVWPAKPIDAFSSLITVAGNQGATLHPEPGVFLRPSEALAALEVLHALARLVPAENLTHNPIQAAEMLAAGDRWAYSPLLFGYTNYSRRGFRHHRLQYVDIPAGDHGPVGSLLGGAGVAVSAQSRLLDEARRFAFWVASRPVQAGVYFDGGGQPGHGRAWDDDRLNQETLDFFRGTRATLDGAQVRPRSVGYIRFQDRVSPWVTATLAGRMSDGELVDRMNDASSALVDGRIRAGS